MIAMDWATLTTLEKSDVARLRHAADIDRQADMLLSVGRFTQAERLAHLAMDLRRTVGGADRQLLAAILDDNPTLTWRGFWNGYDARTQPPGAFQQFRRETLASDGRNGLAQFKRAMAFLEIAPRIKLISLMHSAYGWKHTVERWHRSRNEDPRADVYCGEGCFLAAAIASGLKIRRDAGGGTYVNLGKRAWAMGGRS